jgi:uncharacterized protein
MTKKTFSWKPTIMGPEMGDYVVIDTSPHDPVKKFPTNPGRNNCGLFKKSSNNSVPSIVMGVEDIQSAMKRITEAGGQILGEPVMIPGNGEYVSFIDTEGNRCSIIQPVQM